MQKSPKKLTYQEARDKLFTLDKDDLGEMHYREILLVLAIRTKFRWGPMEIQVKDGVPVRILRAYESLDFDKIDDSTLNDIINR